RIKLNVDLARKNLVESIYKQAMLEGVATTFSDTETIVNGGKVNDMSAEDITKVINLKHAWNFILDENVIAYPTSFPVLTQINALVEEGLTYSAGKVRMLPVSIGGSSYIPPIPLEYQIKEELLELLNKDVSVDVAIELVLFIMKKQIFTDGNKRTAIIFANHYLVSHGLGLIVIPSELVSKYKKLLIDYYEDKDILSIKQFLFKNCLITF
ncbi:MAG: Fic family protein, partial [Bacilli bacterium]|nr:Fic family protein [Bacilli bacterium]